MLLRRGARRASGFLLFLVALMPLTLIGVVLSADYTRALLAKRQATNAADLIAMAAATAIVDESLPVPEACAQAACPNALSSRVRIKEEEARARADELFKLAEKNGMLPANIEAELVEVRVCTSIDTGCQAGREVTVRISYKVPSFFVVRIVADNPKTELDGSVSRSAQICDPADPPNDAGCAYPVRG